MPLISRLGAASSRGFGEFNQGTEKLYIEDVFNTYLYTGTGTTNVVNNGIDLSGKGGLVWIKGRVSETYAAHVFVDTARGRASLIATSNTPTSNSTNAAYTSPSNTDLVSFNSNGFTLGSDNWFNKNTNGQPYVAWTFRKAPKFFDVVTWTGDGDQNRTIPHNLQSVPGMILCKKTSGTSNWAGFHIAGDITSSILGLSVNITNTPAFTGINNSSRFTSTTFKPYELYDANTSNRSNEVGQTYVAYLFAHNAGGFGDDGTQNVISCGSYVGNGAGNPGRLIDVGFEPQFVLVKAVTSIWDWTLGDVTRNMRSDGNFNKFSVTSSDGEGAINFLGVRPTGFTVGLMNNFDTNQNGTTYIYVAIRRGQMRKPTDATKVFKLDSTSSGSSYPAVTDENGTNSNTDSWLHTQRTGYGNSFHPVFTSRPSGLDQYTGQLTGSNTVSTPAQRTNSSVAETTGCYVYRLQWNSSSYFVASSAPSTTLYGFRRATNFFDVATYIGTGSARTVAHNLGSVPELMIVKCRSTGYGWVVYSAPTTAAKWLQLDATSAASNLVGAWNSTAPTSSVFTVGTDPWVNASGDSYITYLFSSCPGVSKVGSYTGTGTTQQINCGFTAGARFILIKRTDSTGDWYVYDSARGIVSGDDPYLLLNSSSPEVTGTDYIDPYSAGFELSSTAPAGLNANGGTYIFLAIA